MLLVAALLFVQFALGQENVDSDIDGVLDSVDKCAETNPEEGLPIITQNEEYLGCSCSQIYESIKDSHCFDIYCASGRPFLLEERVYSSRSTCGKDYCINGTLYDYPDSLLISCINGKEEEFDCEPVLEENSKECIENVLSEPAEEESTNLEGLSLLDDYEKLEKRAFLLSSSDPRIKSGLGISTEQRFMEKTKELSDLIIVEKDTSRQTKLVGNTEKIIVTKTLKIELKNYKKAEEVYVFEELPRGAKIEGADVLSNPEAILVEEGPVLLVWKIETLKDEVEISYQVNKPFEGESNTLIVAREVKSTMWKLMIIPLALIIIVLGVFFYVSEKSVPRRKKIFKD